ncbi:MAG: SGNH/GDSL hydrolase family protein [Flavobacteriaceae bacterium]
MKKKIFLIFFTLIVIVLSCLQEKKVHWVAIGDSITYLNDHLEETGNRVTKGYLTVVNETFPNWEVTNKGYNGWTAIRVAENFKSLNIPRADIYTLFLGTNDWWTGNPLGTLSDFEENNGLATVLGAFRIIIDNIRELNPKAKIILISPMQRVDFVYINNYSNNAFGSYFSKNQQWLEDFASQIVLLGKYEGYETIDLYHHPILQHNNLVAFKRLKNPNTGSYDNYPYPEFIDIPFTPEEDDYPYPESAIRMTYDGLHPSDAGNEVIAEEIITLFKTFVF